MFSKATANFVRQIDPEGSLIPVSRVIDSDKLVPLAIVVKRNRFWSWQRPKYQPTDFTLNDLLGEPAIEPGVSESEFLSYNGTFGDKLYGKLEAQGGVASATLEGKGTSKLQSCFGPLKKEELDLRKLLRDSRNRHVDMEHELVKQLEKKAEVLVVVKGRILTTSPCTITQTKQEQCIFQGLIRVLGMLGRSSEVCVKNSNNLELDSDISIGIRPGTAVAYSTMELEIKKDGLLVICVQSHTSGGFEADLVSLTWPSNVDLSEVDSRHNGQKDKVPLRALLNGSEEMDLSPLAELPQPNRHAFFKKLQETLMERPALTYLQCVLEDLCSGETLSEATEGNLSEGNSELVSAILDPPSSEGHAENGHRGVATHLQAVHLLVSAVEELPDKTLELLSKSSVNFLEALDNLMCRFKESSVPLSVQTLPDLLQDAQAFKAAECLLASASVALRRDHAWVWTETEVQAGILPLVLSLSIHGLAVLCSGLK